MTATPSAPLTVRELTVRGVLLGGAITLVFTAANVYLGLKVGLTFATAIPAAVISMAILRNFAHHSIVENNIVQTVASAAGTLSAIIFVLPGLVMIGWWTGFPYWTTAAVCAVGGILGVMYSIPLRRALVTGSDLPYPEGVAAAEVLNAGPRRSTIAFVTPDRVTYRPELGVLYPSELENGMRIYVEYDRDDPNLVRVQNRNARLAIIPAGSVVLADWLVAGTLLIGLAVLEKALDRRRAAAPE